MRYLFLALFALFSLVHLYFCYINDRNGRVITKPFLIITLLVYYLLSASEVSYLLAAALVASWIGDVLLIGRSEGWLVAGGGFFIGAHICLMLLFFRGVTLQGQPLTYLGIVLAAYVTAAFLVIKSIWSGAPKLISTGLFMYLLINAVMNLSAIMRMVTLGTAGSAFVTAGALMFFLSDCALFLLLYHERPRIVFKRNFTVMITYLMAQVFIVTGMLMG